MSRRINKAMGYGLTGLEYNACRFVDSRLDPAGYLCVDDEEREARWSLEGYPDWLENKNTVESRLIAAGVASDREAAASLDRCVVSQIEYGKPDAVLFIPPQFTRLWQRYGDVLDHEVEALRPDAGPARVEVLTHGIHPWEQQYCDRRTGRRLDYAAGVFRLPPVKRQKSEALAQALGFSKETEARANVTPVVPDELLMLVEYLKVFADPASAALLEPMVYTYWA